MSNVFRFQRRNVMVVRIHFTLMFLTGENVHYAWHPEKKYADFILHSEKISNFVFDVFSDNSSGQGFTT